MGENFVIYLDHHSSTKVCQLSVEKMAHFSTQEYAHPKAMHKKSEELLYHIGHAYQLIYEFIGADEKNTFFTPSNGPTAAMQLLVELYFSHIRKTGKSHIIVAQTEDMSLKLAYKKLEGLGCTMIEIPLTKEGVLDLSEVEKKINPRVSLVSLSWANALTGVIQPISSLSELCIQKNILLHVDATYVLGKIFMPMEDVSIDYVTFTGDIIHGPKGFGGIFVHKKNPLSFIEQDFLLMDIPSLLGFASACQQSILSMDYVTLELAQIRKQFEQKIHELIPLGTILFQNAMRLPNVSCIAFPNIHAEALLYELNKHNVFATIGGGRFSDLSDVLDRSLGKRAISFAMSRYTTFKEMEKVIPILQASLQKFSKISEGI